MCERIWIKKKEKKTPCFEFLYVEVFHNLYILNEDMNV